MILKKETYEMPEVSLILIENSDVITESGGNSGGEPGDDPGNPGYRPPDIGEWDTVM